MKRRLLLLALIFGISLPSFTQTEVDVTKLVADTKTFIFNNNKNTVKGYIYNQLKDVTGCCGNDRIYLEVKIDPSGNVLNVKTLTGKNDCFKQSAIDIVKNVKWDASDFKGPKSIYFEIKPNIECAGNRENTYAQVEVFNNELLDNEGNRNGNTIASTVKNNPIASNNSTQTSTDAKTEDKKEAKTEPKETKVVENKTTQPKTPEKKDPVKTEPKEEKKAPIASNNSPVKKDPPQQTRSQSTKPSVDMAANDNEPPAKKKDELADAEKKAAEERAAQEDEINKLKEQMARLRGQEEAARERRLSQERADAERERMRKEREAEMAQSQSQQNDGTGGGLFLDDPGSNSSDNSYDNEPPTGNNNGDRLQNELAELERQKREAEQKVRDTENNARQSRQEGDRARQELIRIQEQVLEKRERMTQEREEKELTQLEVDRREAEDQERKGKDEYQRMMDEIRRLQDEADRKIAELERKKLDIERLQAAKQAREQEIMLARALRETEKQQELEGMALTIRNSGGVALNPSSITDINTASTSSGESAVADFAIPVMTTKADSQKYIALARTVNLLKVELERLREQLRIMEGGAPSPNSSSIASGNKTNKPRRSNGNLSNAGDDKSWDKIEYLPPNANKDEYIVVATTRSEPVVDNANPSTDNGTNDQAATDNNPADQEVPEYKNGEGYQGSKDHRSTYKNVAGPKFFPRYYVDGRSAMKDKIYASLKDAGVCGLGQATFSVTLDPKGNVLRSKVLAASSALVELQLGAILPTLKFNEAEVRYDQTVYLEFKAEISCEGVDDVKLQNVESIIKNDNN